MNHARKSISLVAALVMACTALMFTAAAALAEEQTVKIVSHNLGSNADSDLNKLLSTLKIKGIDPRSVWVQFITADVRRVMP